LKLRKRCRVCGKKRRKAQKCSCESPEWFQMACDPLGMLLAWGENSLIPCVRCQRSGEKKFDDAVWKEVYPGAEDEPLC
jgi:hypothetical protein